MDGTPVRCGASRVTVNRSSLGKMAGYDVDKSHHAFYWGTKLMLITTAKGTDTAFSLAHPKELDKRKQALHVPHVQPLAPGPCPIVCDKGFAGAGVEKAAAELGHVLVRPRRKDGVSCISRSRISRSWDHVTSRRHRGTSWIPRRVPPQGTGHCPQRSVANVARDLDISAETIFAWRRHDHIDRGLALGLTSNEKTELATAKKRIAEVEAELAVHRRASELLGKEVLPRSALGTGQRGLVSSGQSRSPWWCSSFSPVTGP